MQLPRVVDAQPDAADARAGDPRRRAAGRLAPQPAARIRRARASERGRLLAWLDRGLRRGRTGTLEAEYPLALAPDSRDLQVVAEVEGEIAAYALARTVRVEAVGRGLQMGMIGLVYTDPAQRRRGLAAACIESCCEQLASAGVPLVALWSDRWPFYRRLGFEPAGSEIQYALTPEVCERLRAKLGAIDAVAQPCSTDWPQLEALYRAKPARAARAAGDLARLAGAPECRMLVARRQGQPVAYACMGRGEDFPGVVHEWAGAADGVLACAVQHLEGRPGIAMLGGPAEEAAVRWLRAAGAARQAGCFALVRLLDAKAVWRELVASHPALASSSLCALPAEPRRFRVRVAGGSAELDHAEALALLFGPRWPDALYRCLPQPAREALGSRLPWPMFVWGFDSI